MTEDPGTPQQRARAVTLEEVAHAAGVSRATVSRVINDSPKVSAAARHAVEAAVERLGYAPNRAARSLVTNRTDSIGLVVAESEQRVFGEPFFGSLIRGVSTELAGTDVQLVLMLARSNEERDRLHRFLASHVDGVLLVSTDGDDPLLEQLVTAGLPTVLTGRPPDGISLPYVDADNVSGARSAVTHLLERGRRMIATITGNLDMAAGRDRLTGYREALAQAGFARDERLEMVGDFGAASGERAAQQLIDRCPSVDAIFAASDLMAVGAMRAIRAAGRRVPEDVAVVGFDDSVIAASATPALTSVHQPVEGIGQGLVQVLRALIDGGQGTPSARILPTHLEVRDSS